MLFGFVFVYWINNSAKMFHWRPDVIIIRESENSLQLQLTENCGISEGEHVEAEEDNLVWSLKVLLLQVVCQDRSPGVQQRVRASLTPFPNPAPPPQPPPLSSSFSSSPSP